MRDTLAGNFKLYFTELHLTHDHHHELAADAFHAGALAVLSMIVDGAPPRTMNSEHFNPIADRITDECAEFFGYAQPNHDLN